MAAFTTEKQNGSKTEALTLEKAKQIFSVEVMKSDSDASLIRTYYHPDVRFRDAIQELRGRDAFIEMLRRMEKRCSELDMVVNDAAQNGDVIFLQWTMKMRMGRSPLMIVEGTSKLRLDAQGKVVEHRDYFDPWGDTFDAIPVVGKAYRKLMKKLG